MRTKSSFLILFKKFGFISLPFYWKALIIIGLVGSLILAIFPFSKQYTFGFDQARDAYEAFSIWHNHHLKILGPGTDIPGVYHGALWYYFLALLYGITLGNPLGAGAIYFILMFLTVIATGYVSYRVFKNAVISAVAMLLYAFSPLFQAFSRWFSNPDLTLLVMPVLLLSLWQFLTNKARWSALLVGICFGLLVQSDFGFAMFYLLLPVYFVVYRRKPTIKEIGWFLLGSLLSLGTFILSELKFHFRTTLSILHFFSSPHTTSSSPITSLIAIGQKYLDGLQLSVLPFPAIIVGLFVLLSLIFVVWKRKTLPNIPAVIFLLVWLTNLILFRFFSTGLTTSNFVFAPSLLIFALLVAYFLTQMISQRVVLALVVCIICSAQIVANYGWIKKGVTSLSVQQGITYFQEKKIIAYSYEAAGSKPFTISTVTNPLFINTLWSYLYEFAGKPHYGYVPYFDGRNQEGYLGNLPMKKDETQIHYLIFEPTAGIPDIYLTKAEYTLDLYTDVVEEKHFGNFVVQKRVYHPHKPTIPIPPQLKDSPILYE